MKGRVSDYRTHRLGPRACVLLALWCSSGLISPGALAQDPVDAPDTLAPSSADDDDDDQEGNRDDGNDGSDGARQGKASGLSDGDDAYHPQRRDYDDLYNLDDDNGPARKGSAIGKSEGGNGGGPNGTGPKVSGESDLSSDPRSDDDADSTFGARQREDADASGESDSEHDDDEDDEADASFGDRYFPLTMEQELDPRAGEVKAYFFLGALFPFGQLWLPMMMSADTTPDGFGLEGLWLIAVHAAPHAACLLAIPCGATLLAIPFVGPALFVGIILANLVNLGLFLANNFYFTPVALVNAYDRRLRTQAMTAQAKPGRTPFEPMRY